jgi:nitrate reductase / nitrite oxidoreductase, beta subunit
VLRKLAVIRAIQRAGQLGLVPNEKLPATVNASLDELDDLYRLLAIAKYDDRYVIPPAHAEDAGALMGQHEQLFCSLDNEGGPGMGGSGPPGPHGIQGRQPTQPATAQPATAQPGSSQNFRADDGRTHFNLLGWNGEGSAPNLFPDRGPA